jgi:sugar phosphate isomerase/epimerase
MAPSSRGPGHGTFTPATGVRIPLGSIIGLVSELISFTGPFVFCLKLSIIYKDGGGENGSFAHDDSGPVMQLGFVSAIFAEQSLEEVLAFARETGYTCVEVMCWPPGKADRRYAGVTHLDVTRFGPGQVEEIRRLCDRYQVSISGLGYYPNPLDPNPEVCESVTKHLKQVISAAGQLGVKVVNTFIGRDPHLLIDDQWERMKTTWRPMVDYAEKSQVRLGIEPCPMIFSRNEWPGGTNLAHAPGIWRKLFAEFPTLGLNFDPSHLAWQMIDIPRAIREFGARILHIHAKDARIDYEKLYEVGTLGMGWHTPKIPGLGDVPWVSMFSSLTDAGYAGPVCVEVEDRAFESTLADRRRSLILSKRFLDPFVG